MAQRPYQPDETEQAVLDVLEAEGRANPYHIREQVGERKQYINDALTQLVKAGFVTKINRGLYEYAGGGRVTLDRDDVGELVEILDHTAEPGASVWAERLREGVGDV